MSELNTPAGVSRSGSQFELEAQKAALAIVLIRFLDLTGGADGMSPGRGDSMEVRAMALNALNRAGFAYGKAENELPGLEEPMMERPTGRLRAVAHVPANMAPNRT
jgi:hypothetical protein